MRLAIQPFLAAVVVASTFGLPSARSADAQGVHPALLVGAGRSDWSGPYTRGSESAYNLAGAVDWDVRPRVTLRAELGLASRGADMGPTGGFFDEQGTLLFTQTYVGLLSRIVLVSRAERWRGYVEAGVAAYGGATCDVDLAGGPGFLGGVTYGCDEWVPEGELTGRSVITGVSSGVRPVIGLGASRRWFGATARLEPMGTLAKTPTGRISATTVTLNVELTYRRRR
jgi:hypothetical protein